MLRRHSRHQASRSNINPFSLLAMPDTKPTGHSRERIRKYQRRIIAKFCWILFCSLIASSSNTLSMPSNKASTSSSLFTMASILSIMLVNPSAGFQAGSTMARASTLATLSRSASAATIPMKSPRHHRFLSHRTISTLPSHWKLEALRGGDSTFLDKNQRESYRQSTTRHFFSSTRKRSDNDDETVTTVSTSSTSSTMKRKRKRDSRWGLGARQAMANVISGTGFVASSAISLITDRRTFKDRFVEPIKALRNYLQVSGVDTELTPSLNRRLAINLCLLGRVHMYLAKHGDDDFGYGYKQGSITKKKRAELSQFWQEAKRYMRYATAVYGQSMIHAAEVDARGTFGGSGFSIATKDAISTHIDVPADDIKVMDVDYAGDLKHLRHMVVVDHKNKKVVLSIRGTFNLDEIIKDAAAFSKEFCGGEAHSEMASMAEGVWKIAGPTVKGMLKDHDDYELILTGHSLGAGTACLLMIMLESKQLLPAKQKIRCFAYAAPPVFTPLEFVPKSVAATTNFVHENDAISFLSVHTVRQLFQQIRAVDAMSQSDMTRRERYQVVLGTQEPPKELIASVVEATGMKIKPIEGAPILSIPAKRIIWLKKNENSDDSDDEGLDMNDPLDFIDDEGKDYDFEILKPRDMLKIGIRVNPDMLLDHFPPRYEHAFDHVKEFPTE